MRHRLPDRLVGLAASLRSMPTALCEDFDVLVRLHGRRYSILNVDQRQGKTARHMPDEFINAEGNGVTQAFHAYCRPLLGSGMPESHRIRAPRVPKILHI
jgi:6-phosphofructokinase 1